MDQVTQQNAALVEEAAAAAQSMQEQAGSLSQVVGTFKLDDVEQPVMVRPKAPQVQTRPVAHPVPPAGPQPSRRAIGVPQRKHLAATGSPAGGGDWETF
jgi:methyl-accepting chemotaxis protein